MRVTGKIRFFMEGSGEGMIRLTSGESFKFYSCNVKGANSLYPELVTNISFDRGEEVTATLSDDEYLIGALGLIGIEKGGWVWAKK